MYRYIQSPHTQYILRLLKELNLALQGFLSNAPTTIHDELAQIDIQNFTIFLIINKQGLLVGLRLEPPFYISGLNEVILKTTQKTTPYPSVSSRSKQDLLELKIPLVLYNQHKIQPPA